MRNERVIEMVGFSLGWLVLLLTFRHAQLMSDHNVAEFHSGADRN